MIASLCNKNLSSMLRMRRTVRLHSFYLCILLFVDYIKDKGKKIDQGDWKK